MELRRKHWGEAEYKEFTEYLNSFAEEEYKKFSHALIPETPDMLGIRIPVLRRIAKEILKGNFTEFLELRKGKSHEEGIVEGLVMAGAKLPYPQMLKLMKRYSGIIYNWAMCDTVVFKGIRKHRAEFFHDVDWFLESENPWVIRCGLLHLMNFYLDSEYILAVLEKILAVKSDFYYVEMMISWFLATAVAKCREETISALRSGGFSPRVMKMTAQKVRDSRRVSESDKALVTEISKNVT